MTLKIHLEGELTMSLKSVIVVALCGSTLVSSLAFGQENRISKADIRVEASVPLVKSTNQLVESINQDAAWQPASVNGGFLCTYRSLSNISHNTQAYSPYKGSTGLRNNLDQVCATYVFRFSVKRWSPTAPAASLIFDPRTATGSAADFNFGRGSSPRSGHRGSFYNSATVNTGGLNDLYRFSNSEVPAAVFGYNF
jgi:hypothetical protein